MLYRVLWWLMDMLEGTQKRLVKRLVAEAWGRQAVPRPMVQTNVLELLTLMCREGVPVFAEAPYVKHLIPHLKRNGAKPVACVSQHEG